MLEELSWEEFDGWMTYYVISPWGEERADLRCGIITSKIHNVNVIEKSDLLSPIDFMPYAKRPEPEPISPEEWERAKSAHRAVGERSDTEILVATECVLEEIEVIEDVD